MLRVTDHGPGSGSVVEAAGAAGTRPRLATPRAIEPAVLAFLLLLTSISCRSVSREMDERALLARGEDQLSHQNFVGARTTFSRLVVAADSRELRAEALLGLGRAEVELGNFDEAIDVLAQARRSSSDGLTVVAIERATGEAYFRRKEFATALRHLKQALGNAGAAARQRLLVQMAVSAHREGNAKLGDTYLGLARRPLDPEDDALLRQHLPPHVYPRASRRPESAIAQPRARRPGKATPSHVLSRHRWNARPIRRNVDRMGSVYRITVHHTGMVEPNNQALAVAADTIEKIQKNHQTQRGWADIGYHFMIDRSGRVWQGRPIYYQGAHAKGRGNEGNIGVALMGDFTRQRVTSSQTRSLVRFLDHLCDTYAISRYRVYTHSEMTDTACPGPQLEPLIRKYRRGGLAYLGR